MMEKVIVVDEQDQALGSMEKMEAHRKGVLHRAFSILIFNSKSQLLLQKRAQDKYHSGGLWTNTCCSHPLPGEKMEDATRRKLKHEMGIDLQPEFAYKFFYKINLENNLIEHECDHVFTAVFDGEPIINKEEVSEWKFMDVVSLKQDIKINPDLYTYWFKLILNHAELRVLVA